MSKQIKELRPMQRRLLASFYWAYVKLKRSPAKTHDHIAKLVGAKRGLLRLQELTGAVLVEPHLLTKGGHHG